MRCLGCLRGVFGVGIKHSFAQHEAVARSQRQPGCDSQVGNAILFCCAQQMTVRRGFSTQRPENPPRIIPVRSEECNSDNLHPVFSFEHLDPKQWQTYQKSDKVALSDKLFKISHFTCRELRLLGRDTGSEYLSLKQLSCAIPGCLETASGAVVFHMAGNIAIVCIKEANIHYIITVDRKFKAYRHG